MLAFPFMPAALRAADQPAPATVSAITELIAQIRQAAPANRQKLIETAIANNPAIASGLGAALITNFPADAATMTKIVVDSVIGLGISNTAKSEILLSLAQAAVQAALQIPPSSVTDLIVTVNGVKDALANVPPEFKPSVAAYIIPIAGNLDNTDTKTKPIVSSDTL
jgi:hypothetical protein